VSDESLLMLTLPNSGSTWLAEQIAAHSRWSRYHPEFFNPLRNPKHYAPLAEQFGCELIDCYRNIARGGDEWIEQDIDDTWGTEDFNFTKEVFSPLKLEVFCRMFRCFVMLRNEEDTFPPKRIRVWSFYEHAWAAACEGGVPLGGGTVEARAIAAFRWMQSRLLADADRFGVPVIHYRDLFDDHRMPGLIAAAIGECSDDLRAAIVNTRTLCPR
jgi:hypothetical protein